VEYFAAIDVLLELSSVCVVDRTERSSARRRWRANRKPWLHGSTTPASSSLGLAWKRSAVATAACRADGGRAFGDASLCCMDRQADAVSVPRSWSGEADILRPAEFEHAI
jgi:hypothetical protein